MRAKLKVLTKPQYMWYPKAECVVELMSRGHFPTTIMVKLPNDKVVEIDLDELDEQ
jgi:hypothetical protein